MYKITKEFNFSAAHQLSGLPAEHPCTKLHGHNYIVKTEFKNPILDNIGFVIDYRKLEPIKRWINDNLDHQNLNIVFNFNPTAENIAKALFDTFKAMGFWQLYAVEISETPKTNARYEPDNY